MPPFVRYPQASRALVLPGAVFISTQEKTMKAIGLWLLGVPISVIILLKIFGVF